MNCFLDAGVAVSWEALFVYDILIVSLTLYKAYQERSRHRIMRRDDLFSLIVRDGEFRPPWIVKQKA